jgi:Lar family restriction alleviation protein
MRGSLDDMWKPIEGLKPCPFCGETRVSLVERAQSGGDGQYTIVCWSCAAEGGWSKSAHGAKRYWEMRPEEKHDA